MSWTTPPLGRGRSLPDLSEPEPDGPAIGETSSSLALLQAVYGDPGQPMQRRLRAAIAALPFEHPKLAVVARFDPGEGFAAKLEAAIKRGARPLIEGTALAQPADGCVANPEGSGDIDRLGPRQLRAGPEPRDVDGALAPGACPYAHP
jgi:hypothetical protein